MSNLLKNFNHLLNFRSKELLIQMDNHARQVLLQELVRQDPEEVIWKAICELFAAWPEGEERKKGLMLADQALATWDDGLRHLSSSWKYLYQGEKLASLASIVRSIDLYRREEYGSRELWAIANSDFSQKLTFLTIFKSEIISNAFKAIADSPYLVNLKFLEIKKTIMSERDFELLLKNNRLSNLKTLHLIGVGLKHTWLHPISKSMPFKYLEEIDFSDNFLKSEGLAILSKAKWLASIQTLKLRDNYIQADSIIALAKSPYLKELKLLDLSGNPLTEVGKENLLDLAKEKGFKAISM